MRTITIDSGSTSGSITITLPSDDLMFQAPMGLSAILVGRTTNTYRIEGSPNRSIFIRIEDDDGVLVGFTQATYTATEGESTTVRIRLRGGTDRIGVAATQTVSVVVVDLQGFSQTVMIDIGEREASFSYTAPDDDHVGTSPPDVTLQLTTPENGRVSSASGSAMVSIEDDDVGVGFGQATYTATEGDQFTARVELKGRGVPTATITVRVQISINGAVTQNLTFLLAGDITFAEFALLARDDDLARVTPDMALEIIPPHQGFGVAPGFGTATVQITDNDPVATVGFSSSSFTVTEGETVMLSVELQPNLTATQTVSVTVSDGEDFTQDVTIQSGQREASFSYTAPDDERAAPPAARTLQLSDPVNGSVASASGSAAVNFTDDNDPVAAVGFSNSSFTVTEGEMAMLSVELQPNLTATQAVSVTVSDGQGFTQDVTIQSGQREASFSYTAPDDDRASAAPAARTLQLSDPVNGSVASGSDSAAVNFTDDNDPVAAVGFSSSSFTVTEGEMAMLSVELQPNLTATQAVSVTVSDGQGFTQDVTIQSGQREAGFSYTAPDDDLAGVAPAARTLQLSDPVNGSVASGSDSAAVNFTDNDPVATVGFSSSSFTVTEGETAMLSVELQPNVTATRAVSVTVSDGQGFSQDVTIQNGQREASFSYTAPDDTRAHGAPAARTLQLSDPVNGSIASGSDSAAVNFTDDGDPVATFRLAAGPETTVPEGSQATLMVETVNSVPVTRTTRVRVAFSAEFGDDPQDAVAVLSRDDNSAMLTVQTPDNNRAGRPTTLTASLVSSDNGALTSDAAQAQVAIELLDDGKDLAVVVFAPRSDQQILQGSRVKFVARLQGGLTATEAVTARLTFSDGRAPRTVTIPPGSSEVEFEVQTTTSGPTPPPLQLMLASPGGSVADADAASATLVQTSPLLGAEVPAAGGVELTWWQLAALAFVGALALLAAPLLPRAWRRSR